MDKRQAKEALAKLLKKYNFDSSAVWDCHGTPVLLHKACEQIAIVEGIRFERPAVVESNTEKGIVVVVVEGELGDKREWSFGECSPKNNKNGYPYAMAEKRAKDRVVLKLIGMSGYLYSEDEMDDFKEANPALKEVSEATARKDYNPSERIDDGNGRGKSAHQARKEPHYEEYLTDLRAIDDYALLPAWWESTRKEENYKAMPESYRASLKEQVEIQRDKLKEKETA